ncbi:M23 family metallopeptidase [Klebsiella pneumoniae]|uniref:M23 family metallopeptidase n=1 Tax=Klebsiella pneumoniae TaxID=573 RepID=UPI001330B443|nr:M23 family metallopeptidase [Klebsiella pneumoniae]MBC4979072.1 M23 family metallopeptidase [Klebsiella pneumoniae]MBC5010894.1 M23 family metallopeptidase [Klebsiella pneumoniae]MBN6550521.1 M23 family metallopeptidase [Klebsiella pneumoniae]MBZ2017724.1 M23 family metallopeptidase [Klebsiella pneumoniae]MCB3596666.1 M23 family metallopeptidase [Klebsiella pneumoniae]
MRAIADGTVVSLRKSSDKRDLAPFNINADKPNTKGSNDGYVLIKHETEIGSGDEGKVAFYSLYMHLKSLAETVKAGDKVYRKDPIGLPGMVDGVNAFHFQIFCDDDNISKLTGRKTGELDISKNGRTDAVYGDIHFYLPPQTKFYDKAPADNSISTTGLSELYTSNVPLYASMTLAQGKCTMVTRQKNTQTDGKYDLLGEPLVNADGDDYEYNLYKTAMRNYKESPSAGFELLRFGRVINTDHETLVPADAPLWMTVNYPGGKGVINLADSSIKKFSDADFPHWTGWQMVDDDSDSNSQCNSAIIKKLHEVGDFDNQCGKLICHFPFEWEKSTIDIRFSWLKTGNEEHEPMTEADYAKFKSHAEALCFDSGALSSDRLWHFEPKSFIRHFRKCSWLDSEVIEKVMTANASKKNKNALEGIKNITLEYYADINTIMRKYNFSDANRICHFLGQGAVESGYLLSMQETSQQQIIVDGVQQGGVIVEASTFNETTKLGHWYGALKAEKDNYFSGKKYNSRGGYITGSYSWINGNCGDVDAQKFRGRGFKMLTGLNTYSSYWVYRGWLSKNDLDKYWWDDPEYKKKNSAGMKKKPPKIGNPQKVTENAYNCIDTGGFFIVCFKSKVLKIMDEDKIGKSDDDSIILKVTKNINGADKGIAERKIATKKAKEMIDDEV